jgi:hypothetical protein
VRAESVIRQLKVALERLTWDADQQIGFISRLRVGADELALEFDDAYRTTSGMIAEGLLPHAVGDVLRPVDEILTMMTDAGQEEWTESAVTASPAWERLRDAAKTSLQSLMAMDIGIEFSPE